VEAVGAWGWLSYVWCGCCVAILSRVRSWLDYVLVVTTRVGIERHAAGTGWYVSGVAWSWFVPSVAG